jgi:site-specific recombinase XerD
MSGVSLYAVQKLLGHTTSKTTEIYSHLMPQQLHDEINMGLHNIEASLFHESDSAQSNS